MSLNDCNLLFGFYKKTKLKNCKKKAALLGGFKNFSKLLRFTFTQQPFFLIKDNNKDEAKKDKANNAVKDYKH